MLQDLWIFQQPALCSFLWGGIKSWHSTLIFSVIIRKYKKKRNKFGIYPIKTSFYGHIQYEKKLPYGRFFSLFPWLVKILNLQGNTIYKFIHRANAILLFCKFVIKQIKSSIIVTRTTVLKTLLPRDSNYEKKVPYGSFFSY